MKMESPNLHLGGRTQQRLIGPLPYARSTRPAGGLHLPKETFEGGDHPERATKGLVDKEGKMEVLRSDPRCNTWVTLKPDGSLVVGSGYDGCFVNHRGADYVVTIGIPRKINGKKNTLQREIRCSDGAVNDSPSPDQCAAIPRADRLLCSTSQSLCPSLGCCYDPSDRSTPCYFGSAVTAFCTQDGQFSIAVSKGVTVPSLLVSSIRLAKTTGPECDSVNQNNVFRVFSFPISSCGTNFQVLGDKAVYENQVIAEEDVRSFKGASITRDSTMRILVRCYFTVSGFLPLKAEVATLPPPPPASSQGPLMLEMRISLDSTYRQYYTASDYPIVKVLRDPVFIEVRILHIIDPDVVLLLHQCWATPTSDPLHEVQWPILVDGCPFTGDNYRSELLPVTGSPERRYTSHYSHFNLKMFTFVDVITQNVLGNQVYVHCSGSVCVPSPPETCTTTCSGRSKRSFDLDGSGTELVTSEGPIFFHDVQGTGSHNQQGVAAEDQSEEWLQNATLAVGGVIIMLLVLALGMRYRLRKTSVLIGLPRIPGLFPSIWIWVQAKIQARSSSSWKQ
ncbi:zona pellucida sperm-binding protein 4-like [Spea bombifrons]|uniref:zona pellucida sperm-binding protein 4-like n=1 Tax=Spea bombifrons TaxID=233779 RepID=UPI00234A365C|nr:zona pellucida sperm-binding protein 4-like [Spea bombifrons]